MVIQGKYIQKVASVGNQVKLYFLNIFFGFSNANFFNRTPACAFIDRADKMCIEDYCLLGFSPCLTSQKKIMPKIPSA